MMSELPFLKHKSNQGGGGPSLEVKASPTHENSMQDDLLDQVVDELLSAIETKNRKMLKEALTALVLHIQDQDQSQDEAMTE